MKNFIVFTLLISFFSTGTVSSKDYHVAINGNDKNSGSKEAPFRTLEKARNTIRESGLLGKEPIKVIIHQGIYRFSRPFVLKPEDSGKKGAEVSYCAAKDENVVFTTAEKLDLTWKKWKGDIYKVKLNKEKAIDQIFVNGVLQQMARYPNFIQAKINSLSENTEDHKTIPFNGIAADAWSAEKSKDWNDPSGAYMHGIHKARWGGIHYRVTGKKENGDLDFIGGWQNNRVDDFSAVHKEFRMIENIFEELDAPGEWFFDQKRGELYFYPPEKVSLDQNPAIEAVFDVQNIISIYGEHESRVTQFTVEGGNGLTQKIECSAIVQPVQYIKFQGIAFTGTARTFMETKESLLRSDWTIFRGGAIHIKGAEDISINNCRFQGLGGNAVFVDGYNRNVAISSSVFEGNGASDVCFVGSIAAVRNPLFAYDQKRPGLNELDTIVGPKTNDYPADCRVEDCLMTKCGRVEKQTAGVNISMSSRITVRHNTIYHVPRAAINICDGTWGGHLIEWNKCFETVLETSDHGAFNSWGRDRFWYSASPNGPRDVDADGVPVITSVIKRFPNIMLWDAYQTSTIRNNFMMCDNGWDIDLDDGSTNYDIYNNLCLRGGLKTREGYHRNVYNNIIFKHYTCNVPYPKPSYDRFFANIILGGTYRSTIATLWSGLRDYNLFHNPEMKMSVKATAISDWTQDDQQSIVADAKFIDAENGNFNVEINSPAIGLGFRNFPFKGYGVISEHLKEMAPEPEIIMPAKYFNNVRTEEKAVSVLNASLTSLDTESKLTAYGARSIGGAIILKLPEHSKLYKLGFKLDDVVLKVGKAKIYNARDFAKASSLFSAGKTYTVEVLRGQEEITIEFVY
ncbi:MULTISPECIES: right-handed parallel beta-helix repeat-containing protein [unclassified Saccharicrinis]|uniref:right-handed parallel beta-helix repeat-containing protein n=1 Tax=unclassified Saccharicrinis TaxID=2646859 RepID=UPI003D325092